MNDEILEDDYNQVSNQLPQFLNVLTILTFIGSGLGILGSAFSLLTIESQRANLETMRGFYGDSGMVMGMDVIKITEISLDNVGLLQGSALIAAIACIVGAMMMRKLQRNGFYIYLAASILATAVPIKVFGFSLMGGMVLFGALFTVAFVIMYGVNLKHMR